MSRTTYYNNLVNHIPPGLYQDVFRMIASTSRFHRITRQGLVDALHADDRQIRDVIADLVINYRVPILSESGKPGYWLAENVPELIDASAELRSRAKQLIERALALERAEVPAAKELRQAAEIQTALF